MVWQHSRTRGGEEAAHHKKLAADERVPIQRTCASPCSPLRARQEARAPSPLGAAQSHAGLNYFTKRYSRRWLRADSIAGLAVAAYLIPQVMAYSAIVNVPPVASLWAALAAIVAYVVLGSSRILSADPSPRSP